jgi:hypothetical protein
VYVGEAVSVCCLSKFSLGYVRFQVLTAVSVKFRFVFWDVLPCKIIVILMMEAARTSETLVNNYFTLQYIPEDKFELHFSWLFFNQQVLCNWKLCDSLGII